jgi:hypothetical protein
VKKLVYTFRTFPEISLLEESFGNVFVFGKLKEDLEMFLHEIKNEKPDLILGVAELPKRYKISKFESQAINQFHQINKVSKHGKDSYPLFIPDIGDSSFRVDLKKNDDSFCNWTMYKICEYIGLSNNDIKHTFCHINVADINKLKMTIDGLDR